MGKLCLARITLRYDNTHHMQKFTKIVATIGPATETEEQISLLIQAGMNMARFNTKHGTPEWHQERIARVRKVAKKLRQSIAVLLDLQGPEIRITIPGGEAIMLKKDQEIEFTSDATSKDPKKPFVPQEVINTLDVGNVVLIDDGAGEFEVVGKAATSLTLRANNAVKVGTRKTLNTPGVTVDMPSLIDSDMVQIDGIKPGTVDYVGLSFVRGAKDIEILRHELKKRSITAGVIAKIETQAAVDNLEEIVDAADAVMVARGDLGVEVPYQELSFWQKNIIKLCRLKGKPVITATQMLKSMVSNPRPTRAEVSDVANAIYDGTDAIMLSEETTIGEYPVQAVATQASIAEFNELYAEPEEVPVLEHNASAYMTHAALSILEDSWSEPEGLGIDKIVCLTETGNTAQLISRFRPPVEIHALTSTLSTYYKLSLCYGVTPHVIDIPANELLLSETIITSLKELGVVEKGETILLIHGTLWKQAGLTNTLSVLTID